jgi:hypothetical protein
MTTATKAKKDGKGMVRDALGALKGGGKGGKAGAKPDKKGKAGKAKAAKPGKGGKAPKARTPEEAAPAPAAVPADGAAPAAAPGEVKGVEATDWVKKHWGNFPVVNIPVDKVRLENRYRSDMPGIRDLAGSIGKNGLMHAIVVEPADADGSYRLTAGGRRTVAVRDELKFDTIPARIVDTSDLEQADRLAWVLAAEMAENDDRVDPKWSDKVKRKEELDRVYQRAPVGGKAKRERVAEALNTNPESLRQARLVFAAAKSDELSPEKKAKAEEIAKKLDDGKIAVAAAARAVIQLSRGETDEADHPLGSDRLIEQFKAREEFDRALGLVRQAMKAVSALAAAPGGDRLARAADKHPNLLKARPKEQDGELETVYSCPGLAEMAATLAEARPYAQCPVCAQEHGRLGKFSKGCETCHGTGHVGDHQYKALDKAGDPAIATLKRLAAEHLRHLEEKL